MGVCDKSVFTYKRGGGWGGLELLTEPRAKKKENLYSGSRNVQEIKLESDHNGNLEQPSIAVIFGNFRIL